jgi:hypothetical protein
MDHLPQHPQRQHPQHPQHPHPHHCLPRPPNAMYLLPPLSSDDFLSAKNDAECCDSLEIAIVRSTVSVHAHIIIKYHYCSICNALCVWVMICIHHRSSNIMWMPDLITWCIKRIIPFVSGNQVRNRDVNPVFYWSLPDLTWFQSSNLLDSSWRFFFAGLMICTIHDCIAFLIIPFQFHDFPFSSLIHSSRRTIIWERGILGAGQNESRNFKIGLWAGQKKVGISD